MCICVQEICAKYENNDSIGTKVRCEYSNESQKYLWVAVDLPSYLDFENKYEINIK